MEPLKWEKIDIGTFVDENAVSFHVDTRFFHCMYTVTPLEKVNEDDADYPYYKKFNKICDIINENNDIDEKYLISREEIIPFIYTIREIRNLNETIILNFDVENCEWWVKYIRFYKYKDRYIVTNDCVPIDWKKMTKETIKII